MRKEKEVKILNVDAVNLPAVLERIGCKFQFDRIQRFVTYDFHPINSTFVQLAYEIRDIGKKNNSVFQLRLERFLHDLFDIVSDKDKKAIIDELSVSYKSKNLFKVDFGYEKLDFFYSPIFTDIVEKYSINPNKWIRIRTDGVTTTIATKKIDRATSLFVNNYDIHAVDETELQISDFHTGIELMQQLGYFYRSYHEKRRVMYISNDGLEIDIDFWPMIPPYLEIEGEAVEAIYNMIDLLGFKKSDAIIINTDDVYKIYGLNIYDFPELKLNGEVHT